jgi:hypothetical protein
VGAETLSALFSSCKQVCCTTTCHVAWCMFFGGSYRAASTCQVPSAPCRATLQQARLPHLRRDCRACTRARALPRSHA